MEVAKNVSYNETGRLKPFYYDQKDIYSPGKNPSSYYLRLAVDNKTGVLAKISAKLAEQKISVLSIVQRIWIQKLQFLPLLHLNAQDLIF